MTFTALGTPGTSQYRYQVKIAGSPVWTWIPQMAAKYTTPTGIATMPVQSLGATN